MTYWYKISNKENKYHAIVAAALTEQAIGSDSSGGEASRSRGMSRLVAPHFNTHRPTCTLKQSQSKESTCVTLSIKYSIYIMVYGMALPYQICTWSGSCHTCSRAPVWCCWKSKPTHTVLAYCGICMGASLKYKWQRMKTMMSLLLTTTFILTGLRAVIIVRIWVISDHCCEGYMSGLVREGGSPWKTVGRMPAWLFFYKGLRGLSAIPCDSLCRPVRNSRHSDWDTFTILSSRLDCYKYSFFPRSENHFRME